MLGKECKYTSKSQPDNPYAKEIHNLNKKIAELFFAKELDS